MSANLEQIRLAIGLRMASVPDIGIVQPYERYSKAETALAAQYMRDVGPKKELRGWFIRRVATRELAYLRNQSLVEHDWQIRGFLSFQDAEKSEIVMDSLVEQLRATFLTDLTLGGLVDERRDAGQPIGLQLGETAPYMFAGILCHGVRLDLTTRHYPATPDDPASLNDFATFHVNWDIPVFGNVLTPLPADETADATDHITLETE